MDNSGDLNFDFTDPQTITRLVGLLVPLLVGVITKKVASQGLKSSLNALLSAIAGSISYLFTVDGDYEWAGFVNAVINTYIVSIATYYGIWKPTGIAGTVAEKTSGFGIGKEPVLETDDKGEESPADAAGTPTATVDDAAALTGSAAQEGAAVPNVMPSPYEVRNSSTHNQPGDDLSGD